MEDKDCYQVNDNVDGRDTGSVEEHSVVCFQRDDAQSVEGSASEVNSEEDGLDFRIGAVQTRQISEGTESMDQVDEVASQVCHRTVQDGLQSSVRSSS